MKVEDKEVFEFRARLHGAIAELKSHGECRILMELALAGYERAPFKLSPRAKRAVAFLKHAGDWTNKDVGMPLDALLDELDRVQHTLVPKFAEQPAGEWSEMDYELAEQAYSNRIDFVGSCGGSDLVHVALDAVKYRLCAPGPFELSEEDEEFLTRMEERELTSGGVQRLCELVRTAHRARTLSQRGPFELTSVELAEIADARRETNPELYPGTRTAILLGAIERAQRTLGPKPIESEERADCDALGCGPHTYHEWLAPQPRDVAEFAHVEADPEAPQSIALLPNYWDARRAREGKADLSRCAADLRAYQREALRELYARGKNTESAAAPKWDGQQTETIQELLTTLGLQDHHLSRGSKEVHDALAWWVRTTPLAGAFELTDQEKNEVDYVRYHGPNASHYAGTLLAIIDRACSTLVPAQLATPTRIEVDDYKTRIAELEDAEQKWRSQVVDLQGRMDAAAPASGETLSDAEREAIDKFVAAVEDTLPGSKTVIIPAFCANVLPEFFQKRFQKPKRRSARELAGAVLDGNGQRRAGADGALRELVALAESTHEQAETRAKLDALIADWRTRGPAGKDVREVYGWAADELLASLKGGSNV